MLDRPARTSPRAPSCRPHLGRRAVSLLLLVTCVPSLALNAGAGRNLLIHDHDDVHAHVLSFGGDQHGAGGHDDALGHAGGAVGGDPTWTALPTGGDCDGAVLRGSAVGARKDRPTPSAGPADLGLAPLPICCVAPPAVAPARPALAATLGPRATDMASLRAVVLLI